MPYLPLFERILLKPEPVTEGKHGSIIIPDSVKESEPLNFGIVVSRGTEAKTVNEGDRVLYPKSSGVPIQIDEVEHLILFEREILMIV